nr:MAG TPA: recombination endonuclease VII [Siphoviridae sp. ct5YG1]DAU41850.1 MAG TPA: dimeris T4 recombination endonuclease VII [Bacteriophage sp.]
MKFINRRTGVILEPGSPMVEDQLRKSADYAPYEPQKAAEGAEKPLAKMSKAELLEAAQAAGIAVPDDATKAQIVELIQGKA